jgi:hypothetical protein
MPTATDALVDQTWQAICINDAPSCPALAMVDILNQLTALKAALNALE